MNKIKLTQGHFAIVDDEDYVYLNQWTWCAMRQGKDKWRVVRGESQFHLPRRKKHRPQVKLILMHRQIMNAKNGITVDHINGNPLDNRRSNLRLATQAQQTVNRCGNRDSTSRFKGVSWDKDISRWRVGFNGKYIGVFIDEILAAKAYDKAANTHDPEFARMNFPEGGALSAG